LKTLLHRHKKCLTQYKCDENRVQNQITMFTISHIMQTH